MELGKRKGADTAIAVEAECIFQIGASGVRGIALVVRYACAFGDVEARYKTFSFAWYRRNFKERQVQLTYWVSLKHELSHGDWDFRLIGLIQILETLDSHIEYTMVNLLIGFVRVMDLLLVAESPVH